MLTVGVCVVGGGARSQHNLISGRCNNFRVVAGKCTAEEFCKVVDCCPNCHCTESCCPKCHYTES